MKNIVLPNLFCLRRFDFRAVGLQQSSDSLHLSFQNGYMNWVTTLFVSVCLFWYACVSRIQLIYSSCGKTSYLFLYPAKRPVVNLHSKLYISHSRLHEPRRMRLRDPRKYSRVQTPFESSHHQNLSSQRWLTINGLSPTPSIMRGGINIDWWVVIMEWLIICSRSGFGPINVAPFHRMR